MNFFYRDLTFVISIWWSKLGTYLVILGVFFEYPEYPEYIFPNIKLEATCQKKIVRKVKQFVRKYYIFFRVVAPYSITA